MDAQYELIEFLQTEAYHSLGCYDLVVERLAKLQSKHSTDRSFLPAAVISATHDYNLVLREERHRARQVKPTLPDAPPASRHPRPRSALIGKLYDLDEGRYTPEWVQITPEPEEHAWLLDFYAAAIEALSTDQAPGSSLATLRTWLTGGRDEVTALKQRLRARHDRAAELVGGRSADGRDLEDVAGLITEDHLAEGGGSLHEYVLRVFVDAHLRMHIVEHVRAVSFGARLRDLDQRDELGDLGPELNTSRVLSTFVYDVCELAPWIFARDSNELTTVAENVPWAAKALTPPLCMWPAEQALMLALHRRAFSHAMAYDQESALNDYHKLQDHIRGASRRVRGSATPPRGAKTFLAALDALAEYHVGELYRSDHAHACALRRFIGGLRRMERIIELGEIEDPQALLDNSAWRVRLMVSMGKARYEMGSPRRALEWYLKAWRALLVLQSTKKVFGLSADELDDALEWLDATREDPDLDKDEVLEHLEPCVEEIAVTWVAQQLRALAAEVLLRLGHVLMVIRIGERQPHPPRTPRPGDLHGLAHRCLRAAASHDPGLTLVWTDLLRLQLDGGTDRVLQPIEPTFEEQWPLGGDPEQAIRIIEFLMLLALDDASSADSEGCATVARSLLSDFMHHTDSANVKASQADKLLHKVPKPNRHLPRPSLEFVCLRRYSCSFLPRPASFRPLGGGYLVRVHLPGHELPYGIAIDPGPDFVETLYRCHHCLHDIHALIVTHDHADHLASLDALIKLFDRQGRLKLVDPADRPQRFKPEDWRRPPRSEGPDPVVILGSTSVRRRYEGTSVAVGDLLASGELLAALGIPVTLQAYKNRRHLDLGGEPACGLKITLKSGSGSIAFTSDMALEDKLPHDDVLAADVVVTHMGGAPVRELRGLANLDSDVPEGFGDTWDLLSDSLRERLRRVLGLGDDEEPLGPVAPLVRPNRPPMLEGLFDLAQTMASRSMERGARQLLVIGELAEELGTFRAKVAARISESVMDDSSCRALTADVGLRIIIGGWPSDGTSIARILCSTCALDNDRTLEERFHAAPDMREVCVRGENEGIFYNCEPHDPGATSRFVERLDRYDIFGR